MVEESTALRIWTRLAFRILALLFIAALFRAYFAIANREIYSVESAPDLLWTFLFGMRFDFSALMVFDGGLYLVWLWMMEWRAPVWSWQLWRFIYGATNLGLVVACFVDLALFQVHGQRSSVLHVPIAAEYVRQPFALVLSFGGQFILFAVFAALFVAFEFHFKPLETQWLRSPPARARHWRVIESLIWTLVMVTIAVIGIRSGLQGKPLGIANAGDLGSDRLANLALSAPYMLTHWEAAHVEADHFFNDEASLLEALKPEPMSAKNSGVLKGQNVVLIIMESFGREYMGLKNTWPGYTPFLDSLVKKSIGFSNAFANGKNSIEFPPAILAGIPGWQDDPYIRSPYATNSIYSIEQLFRKQGYRTAFFHGVGNGTMYFDSFMKLIGVEKYFGLNEYPKSDRERDFDGTWGIFDGPYFKYFSAHIDQDWQASKQPFFYTVFSVSSHHPYALPKGLESKYTKGEHAMHNVVAYADDALKDFFDHAETQPWFKNTLFIITGDHTSLTLKPEYMTPMGRFRVPIVFYDPSRTLPPTNTSRLAQHMDISVSLMDLFDLPVTHRSPFGRSLFRDNEPVAVDYHDGAFWIAEGSKALVREATGREQLYDYVQDPLFKNPIVDQADLLAHLDQRLKAHIQAYHNGLIENSLFNWATPGH